MIEAGEVAPDFELPDQDGQPARLSELRGTRVVLPFYPKAGTPGCTTQACGIRDHRAAYEAAGVRVIGVSPDPVTRVKRFHDKQSLEFTLLADTGHAVSEAYGVWVEKSMYGKPSGGSRGPRSIIDEDGTVARVFPRVSPKSHDDVVLGALAAQGGAEPDR